MSFRFNSLERGHAGNSLRRKVSRFHLRLANDSQEYSAGLSSGASFESSESERLTDYSSVVYDGYHFYIAQSTATGKGVLFLKTCLVEQRQSSRHFCHVHTVLCPLPGQMRPGNTYPVVRIDSGRTSFVDSGTPHVMFLWRSPRSNNNAPRGDQVEQKAQLQH